MLLSDFFSYICTRNEEISEHHFATYRLGSCIYRHVVACAFIPFRMDNKPCCAVRFTLPDHSRSNYTCGDFEAKSQVLRTSLVTSLFLTNAKRLNNVINFVEQSY